MKQGVYVVSSTPKYPLSTRFAKRSDPLCRVWRYTRLGTINPIGGAYGPTGYGGVCSGLGLFANAKSSGALTIVTAAKGAHTVTISAPALVAGAYAGGLLTMYEDGQPIAMLGIISNTATVILLDGPLPGTFTAAATAQVVPGPYHEVVAPGANRSANPYDPCVGIMNSPLDEDGNDPEAGDYLWLQTWGLCNTWVGADYAGDETGEREVVMRGDGTGQINTALADTTYLGMQRIGFLYSCTGPADENVAEHPGATGGVATTMMNHLVFLQIAP